MIEPHNYEININAVELANDLLIAFAEQDVDSLSTLLLECRAMPDQSVLALVVLTHQALVELAERQGDSIDLVRQALVGYALTEAGGAELAMEHALRNASRWAPP